MSVKIWFISITAVVNTVDLQTKSSKIKHFHKILWYWNAPPLFDHIQMVYTHKWSWFRAIFQILELTETFGTDSTAHQRYEVLQKSFIAVGLWFIYACHFDRWRVRNCVRSEYALRIQKCLNRQYLPQKNHVSFVFAAGWNHSGITNWQFNVAISYELVCSTRAHS